VGGPTLEKNIRRVLGKIFGKKLRTRVNLTGRGGKIAFGSLSLHQILLGKFHILSHPHFDQQLMTCNSVYRYNKTTKTLSSGKRYYRSNLQLVSILQVNSYA